MSSRLIIHFGKDTHIIREHKDRFFAKAIKLSINAEQMVGASQTPTERVSLYDRNHNFICDVIVDVWDEVNDIYTFTMSDFISLQELRTALFQEAPLFDIIYVVVGINESEIQFAEL